MTLTIIETNNKKEKEKISESMLQVNSPNPNALTKLDKIHFKYLKKEQQKLFFQKIMKLNLL